MLNKDKFEIVRGKYLKKTFECPYCKTSINKPEEKKTDVNISVRMIADCVLDKTDKVVLISADSDLIPPLEFIQKHYPKIGIKVYFPPSNFNNDLKDNMLHHRSKPVLLGNNLLKFLDAVMTDQVKEGEITYSIPEKWKSFRQK